MFVILNKWRDFLGSEVQEDFSWGAEAKAL